MSGEALDENSTIFLRRILSNGSALLFTGAGFSAAAYNQEGHPLPLGGALRAELWNVAFPGSDFDDSSTLGDIFDAGLRTAKTELIRTLRRIFTVDSSSVPGMYQDYFSLPWYRIYTLNIDDLIEAVQRRFSIPVPIESISASSNELPPPDRLTAVHINGRLVDLPDVTFSAPQYGQRTAVPDVIYPHMVRELASHPTVYIGTQLDEPALWHYVALRGEKPPGRELRPKSFLVAPTLSTPRAALLERLNIRHVPMNAPDFWREFIQPALTSAVARPVASSPLGDPFIDVSQTVQEPAETPADFLLGREPRWGDVTAGYAISRQFESQAAERIQERHPSVVFVVGTAGSGKSCQRRSNLDPLSPVES